jgi:serine/threonine-protein kinase 19
MTSVAEGDHDVVPSDTLAALLLLRAQFPPSASLPRLLLTSQLYNILADRTATDRELARLAAAGAVRRFKLATGRDEYAFMLASDYAAAVDAAGSAAERAAAASGAAFSAFKLNVLPECPGTHVAATELTRLLAGPGGLGEEGAMAALSRLLNAGLIARAMESGAHTYVFAAPGAGPFQRALQAARTTLRAALRRRPRRQMVRSELEKSKLRGPLPLHFVLRDMLGSGAVEEVRLPGDALLRLAEG